MTDVERLARELVLNWRSDSPGAGRLAFEKVNNARKLIIEEARALDIYDEVYARATDIWHGDS